MKIVVEIPEDILEEVKKVIDEGDFSSPNQFLITAIQNQLQIGGLKDVPTFDEYLSKTNSNTSEAAVETEKYISMPNDENIQTCEVLTDSTRSGPLWGQYNRIFPVKFNLRILVNMLEDEGSRWINLDRLKDSAVNKAREVGMKLKRIDSEKGRKRGEKLSTSFPVGNDPSKSMGRFEHHFMGYVDKEGKIIGAPGKLKFVNIERDEKNQKIGITNPGLEFAKLKNPVLDGNIESDQSLSEEERQFFLDHVLENIQGEREAIIKILQSINHDVNRPKELTEKIHDLEETWTHTKANTIRSGLIGRLSELGMIGRENIDQRKVAYKITEYGNEILEKVGGSR